MISEQGTVRSRQRTGTGSQSGHAQPHRGIREPWIDAGLQGPEFLLDFRTDSEGPVSQALTGRLAIIANNYSRDPRWPGFWAPFRDAGYRSAVSVPMALEPGCCAALTLLAGDANCFTPAVVADVVAFSHLAGRSFRMATEIRAALTTAGQLRAAMEGRTSIDVACGVIMGQNRCSYEDAFNILARASSHRNVKARVVADIILKDLPGGPPATHFKG